MIFNFIIPSRFDGFAADLPTGDYIVEAKQVLIERLSRRTNRLKSTTLQVDRLPRRPGQKESWQISPEALEAALILDGWRGRNRP